MSASALRSRALQLPRVYAEKNGTPIPCLGTSHAFLKSLPSGAYTSMRTVGQTKVFRLQEHMHRLAESSKLLRTSQHACLDAKQMRSTVVPLLRQAVTRFLEPFGPVKDELRITGLVVEREAHAMAIDVYTHVSFLPPLPCPPIHAHVVPNGRSNARAKDSAWVSVQHPIVPDAHETLLCDPMTGEVLEGASSNVFVEMQDQLYTASDGVLAGTVRSEVLNVCEEHGIPVHLQAPLVSNRSEWTGCFLTSTSRLALPVHRITWDPSISPGHLSPQEFSYGDSVTMAVQRLVAAEFELHSEELA